MDPLSSTAARLYEFNETDLFDRMLSHEMILRIFSYLGPEDLSRCERVSRRWSALASTELLWKAIPLEKIFPSLDIFDASDWSRYFGLAVEGEPSLGPKREAIPILHEALSRLGKVEVTLLTIPKGLTFNQLIQLAGAPTAIGAITPFRFIWNALENEFGNIPVERTYRLLMMRDTFRESEGLKVDELEELVTDRGCQMPALIEATAHIVAIFARSQKALLPTTYTCCVERVDVGGRDLVAAVGLFGQQGVMINQQYTFIQDEKERGVAGVLRLTSG